MIRGCARRLVRCALAASIVLACVGAAAAPPAGTPLFIPLHPEALATPPGSSRGDLDRRQGLAAARLGSPERSALRCLAEQRTRRTTTGE